MQDIGKAQATLLRNELDTKNAEPMTLSLEAKDWIQKNKLERFVWVVEAPPHKELKKIATTIDV